VYYNYFKRKKVNNSEFNARKGLVNPSSKYLFKPKFYILSSRSFSTVNSSLKTDVCTQNNTIALNLLPGWVTGFSDGECSFSVNIVKNSQYKTGWSIIPIFCIELHKRDLETLLRIQMFFGGIGRINHLKEKGHVVYSITSVKDLHNVIIPHFTKYPLLTINLFKLIINWDSISYNNMLNGIKHMIDSIINSNDRSKIPVNWEGFSYLEDPKKGNALSMDNQQGGGAQGNQGGAQGNQGGNTPALIQGSPDIKPNGKYNTPNMQYTPGGNNQPYGRIMSKALEDHAIRNHHIDNKGNAATVQWNSNVFENDAARFYNDFMRDKFPNRTQNNYWNSSPVRKALRDL